MSKPIAISFLLFAFLIAFSFESMAQSVGIGTGTPDSSAVLELNSTSKGVLVPRMTEAQRKAIAMPAKGLLVYQTDNLFGFYVNDGVPAFPKWRPIQNTSATSSAAATDQWATQPLSYLEVGTGIPLQELAFDGEYIWGYRSVSGANNLFRIRASDGQDSSSFSINGTPQKIYYDGTYLLVFNQTTLYRLHPVTGAIIDQLNLPVTANIKDVVYDGSRYWLLPNGSRTAGLLNSDLSPAITSSTNVAPVGFIADDILFDGNNVLSLSHSSNNNNRCIRKIDIATLTNVYSTTTINISVLPAPLHMVTDGYLFWVTNGTNGVEYFRANDGTAIDGVGIVYPDNGLVDLRYDGDNIWLCGNAVGGNSVDGNKIQKMNASERTLSTVTFETLRVKYNSLVFDGKAMWISSTDGNNNGYLAKRPK